MAGSGRSKTSQSKHDSKVLTEAKKLKREQYDVSADIAGYKKPPSRGGYRPDILATKGNKEVIIEVETPDSVDSPRDIAQQGAFHRVARKPGVKFKRIITK
jgi:hypothetical protein